MTPLEASGAEQPAIVPHCTRTDPDVSAPPHPSIPIQALDEKYILVLLPSFVQLADGGLDPARANKGGPHVVTVQFARIAE